MVILYILNLLNMSLGPSLYECLTSRKQVKHKGRK
jgi:hypothetical protein